MTPPVPPAWRTLRLRHHLALYRPRQMRITLARLKAEDQIDAIPTPFQVFMGVLYMRYRVLFRPETIGVGTTEIRSTWRARLLDKRPLRFPFLVKERVIAPWDFTGLGSPPDFLVRHLLGAYHPDDHAIYDLALLRAWPGTLRQLRDEVAAIVEGTHPRGDWLADLCVFEGYHDHLLALVDRALEGDFTVSDPVPTDATLRDFVAWMSRQPRTAREALGSLTRGELSLAPQVRAAAA